jgi:hypothetical protein
VKGWKKIYQANGPCKQAGVAILISDKVDFKPTLIKRARRGSTPKGNTNLYALNVNAPNFTNNTLKGLKAYIDNTEVVGDINTPYHQ